MPDPAALVPVGVPRQRPRRGPGPGLGRHLGEQVGEQPEPAGSSPSEGACGTGAQRCWGRPTEPCRSLDMTSSPASRIFSRWSRTVFG